MFATPSGRLPGAHGRGEATNSPAVAVGASY